MPDAWKTVRVFISSTFRDMQAERDHLVRFVFPRLREQLLQRRIHLVDVDLRWGVTGEQDASEVCREIIAECRPRFLCMLGGRYGTIPDGKDLSITADEVHFGVLDARRDGLFALFYFRHGAVTEKMDRSDTGSTREPRHSAKSDRLAKLKREIRRFYRPFVYRPTWNADEHRLLDLKAFGDRVEKDILATIDAESGSHAPAPLDEFAEENAAMEAFADERAQRFVLGSREPVWRELLDHARATGGKGYLCLVGPPGSGKSALLAKCANELSRMGSVESVLIAHFTGASAGSTDIRRTVRRLSHELIAGTGLTTEIPEDPEKLRATFPEILTQASAQKRVIILLDAIDQLDPTPHFAGLWWLPETLPENVRIILSSVPGPALDDLQRRHDQPREVKLAALTQTDGAAIIKEFLQRYRKVLSGPQQAALLAKTAADTPLYLLAALEELRTLGNYDEITDRIANLPSETQPLFAWILKRLEDDVGFRDSSNRRIGKELVPRFAALLSASRHGLSQRELPELLAPGEPVAEVPIPVDSQGNVAALTQLLRPYLMHRGELVDFYHGQFRTAAEKTFLQTDEQRRAAHEQLASYFRRKADPKNDQVWSGESTRGFGELPWHLLNSGQVISLTTLLTSPRFLQSKLDQCGVRPLLADYDISPRDTATALLQSAITLSAHVLDGHPEQLAGHLIGRLLDRPEKQLSPILEQARVKQQHPWICPTARCLEPPSSSLLRTYVTAYSIVSMALSRDERLMLFGSSHGDLEMWDMQQAVAVRRYRSGDPEVLDPIKAVLTPDASLAASVSYRSRRCVWDARSGNVRMVLEGAFSSHSPKAVAVSPDGSRAVIANGAHGEIYSLDTGNRIGKSVIPIDNVYSVFRAKTGAMWVVSSFRNWIQLWDLDTGKEIKRIKGEPEKGFEPDAIACSSSPSVLLCNGLHDDSVTLLDLDNWVVRLVLSTGDRVTAVSVSADEMVVSAGTQGGVVYLWDAVTASRTAVLRGHGGAIRGISFLGGGRSLLTASEDGTARLWKVPDAESPQTDNMNERLGEAQAFSRDGTWVLSRKDDTTLVVQASRSREVHAELHYDDPPETARINPSSVAEIDWMQAFAVDSAADRIITDGVFKGVLINAEVASDSAVTFNRGGQTRELMEWRMKTGEVRRRFDTHTLPALTPPGPDWHLDRLNQAKGMVACHSGTTRRQSDDGIAFTPDLRFAMVGVDYKGLELWDLSSGRTAFRFEGHEYTVFAIAISSDGKYAASGCSDWLIFWDLVKRTQLAKFRGHDKWVRAIEFSVDGSFVVTASRGERENLRAWEFPSAHMKAEFAGLREDVTAIAISRDGKLLASCSGCYLSVWYVDEGRLLAQFIHDYSFLACRLDLDNRIVVIDARRIVHTFTLEGDMKFARAPSLLK